MTALRFLAGLTPHRNVIDFEVGRVEHLPAWCQVYFSCTLGIEIGRWALKKPSLTIRRTLSNLKSCWPFLVFALYSTWFSILRSFLTALNFEVMLALTPVHWHSICEDAYHFKSESGEINWLVLINLRYIPQIFLKWWVISLRWSGFIVSSWICSRMLFE